MDLYLALPRAAKTHPEVMALSAPLRIAARRGGRAVRPSFRNPAGIAMRLRNFGRLDPDAPPSRDAGLRPGGAVDRQIWREFGQERNALAAEVAKVRRSMLVDVSGSPARSSRGPVPSSGERVTVAEDGATGVYLLLLDGPVELLAPSVAIDPSRSLLKIGRTAALDQRIAELASGLPPGAAIHYVPVGLRMFASAESAHQVERRMLDHCDAQGWSLGGEFVYAPLRMIDYVGSDHSCLSGIMIPVRPGIPSLTIGTGGRDSLSRKSCFESAG